LRVLPLNAITFIGCAPFSMLQGDIPNMEFISPLDPPILGEV